MNSLFSLFKALTKNWLRSKSGMFFSILFPITLLIIFTAVFGGQDDVQYTLYIQNNDTTNGEASELSEEFIQGLQEADTFNLIEVEPGEDLKKGLSDDETAFEAARRGLIIPEGFHEKSMDKIATLRTATMQDTLTHIKEEYGEHMTEEERQEITKGMEQMETYPQDMDAAEGASITLLINEGDQAAPMIKGALRGVVDTFNQKAMGIEDSAVKVESESLVSENLEAVDYYLPGFIAAFIMTNGIIGVTTTVTEFKRNGVLKRLAATPLTKVKWILANIMQQTLLAFVLTAIMILIGMILFNVRVFPDIYAVGFILVGAITFSAIGMVLGGFIKDVEAASGAGNAIAFPMMFLSGAFWSVQMMPEYLQSIAEVLPLYHFHQGLINIMILGNPGEALHHLLVILGFTVVFILLAFKTTRWKEL